jgi:hypothetical protein
MSLRERQANGATIKNASDYRAKRSQPAQHSLAIFCATTFNSARHFGQLIQRDSFARWRPRRVHVECSCCASASASAGSAARPYLEMGKVAHLRPNGDGSWRGGDLSSSRSGRGSVAAMYVSVRESGGNMTRGFLAFLGACLVGKKPQMGSPVDPRECSSAANMGSPFGSARSSGSGMDSEAGSGSAPGSGS